MKRRPRLTPHARQRAGERSVSRRVIAAALKVGAVPRGHQLIYDLTAERFQTRVGPENCRGLRVVTDRRSGRVVTVHWLMADRS